MKIVSYLTAAVLSVAVTSAVAWDKPGHSVVSAIAFHDLETNHPEIVAKAVAILKQSADYAGFLHWQDTVSNSSLPPGSQQEPLMLFMLAARWPDDIKGDGSGRDKNPVDTHPWHFINLPYSSDQSPLTQPSKPNIYTAMAAMHAAWPKQTDAEKAISLCWFMHLIGDSHQPLHSAELFSKTYPTGDEGGVRWAIQKIETATALHSFWDDVVIAQANNVSTAAISASVEQEAQTLLQKYSRSSLPELEKNKTLKKWVQKETFPLAIHEAYLDGQLAIPAPHKPTVLSQQYRDNALKISEKQLALAGYRLADYLYALLK